MKGSNLLIKNVNMEYIKHLGVYINNADTYKEEVEKARVYYFGTYYASQLIAAPSNYCNPVSLSNAAVELAQKLNLEYKILGVKELEELKMGAYLSMGKGSMYPNKFIHLTYKSKGDVKKKNCISRKRYYIRFRRIQFKSCSRIYDRFNEI